MSALPDWADGPSAAICGCGEPTVICRSITGEAVVVCRTSGWGVDRCTRIEGGA